MFEKQTETKIVEDDEKKKTLQENEKSIGDILSALYDEEAKVKKEVENEMSELSASLLTKMHEFEELSSAASCVKCVENQLHVIELKIESMQDGNDESKYIMDELRAVKEQLGKVIQLMKSAKDLPWSSSTSKEVKSKWAREYLHVEASATGESIERAYKAMALSKHPNKGGSEEEFKLLQKAYEILSK